MARLGYQLWTPEGISDESREGQVPKLPRTNPAYPKEFRKEAVRMDGPRRPIGWRRRRGARLLSAVGFNLVCRHERDEGIRSGGLTTEEREELKRLRRENVQLKQERTCSNEPRSSSRPTSEREIPAGRGGEGPDPAEGELRAAGSLRFGLLRLREEISQPARAGRCLDPRGDQADPPGRPWCPRRSEDPRRAPNGPRHPGRAKTGRAAAASRRYL